MDLIDKRDEVLRLFLDYGITENKENDLTKTDLAECAEKIVEKLILSGVGKQRELLCINCKEETANRGLGEHKLVCSKCWNKQCD